MKPPLNPHVSCGHFRMMKQWPDTGTACLWHLGFQKSHGCHGSSVSFTLDRNKDTSNKLGGNAERLATSMCEVNLHILNPKVLYFGKIFSIIFMSKQPEVQYLQPHSFSFSFCSRHGYQFRVFRHQEHFNDIEDSMKITLYIYI